MFYSADSLRTVAWDGSLSDHSKDSSKEVREEPGYTGVFAGKINVLEHQKMTANPKNRCLH